MAREVVFGAPESRPSSADWPGVSGEDCVSPESAGWILKSSRLMRRQESSCYASSAGRRAGRAAQGKPLRVHEVAAANRGALFFGDFLLGAQKKVTGPREGTV
jgi:hypothetical protein